MPVQVSVGDSVIHGRTPFELEEAVREGLIIRDYIAGEISIGEVKELMGFQYMDDAMDWLHKKGEQLGSHLELMSNWDEQLGSHLELRSYIDKDAKNDKTQK